MPLTPFQKEVLGVLVDNRSEASHFVGGLVLNGTGGLGPLPTAEILRHFPASLGLKFKNFLLALCHSDIGFSYCLKNLSNNDLCRICRYSISPL